MKKLVIGMIAVLAAAGWIVMRPDVIDVPPSADGARTYPGDEPGDTCDLDKTYERSGAHQKGCECPAGYAFDTTIIGHGPCYGAGTECPILEAKCVPATSYLNQE